MINTPGTEFRRVLAEQRRYQLTGDEGDETSQGNYSPEVIPPEHAFLKAKSKPSNGDYARDEEEGQSRVWEGVSDATCGIG